MRNRLQFPTTQLSLVLRAAGQGKSDSQEALAEVCSLYWFPLYAYIRRSGYSDQDAQDLTQQFFVTLLEREYIRQFEPHRGKLRTFLIAAVKHFLSNERDRLTARKRGGDWTHLPIEFNAEAESRYLAEVRDGDTPEKIYEREWARTLLESCHDELRSEYQRAGKLRLFETISVEEQESAYFQIASTLGISEGALKVAVHRRRRRLREVLRRRIAEAIEAGADVDEEVQYVWTTLGK